MKTFAAARLIAAKDLRLERRTKDVVTSTGLFALLVVVVASFALPTGSAGREGIAAGLLWMAILFASLLGMARSFALEKDGSCIDGLMVSPVPRESIFLGKLLSNLVFTGVAVAGILPLTVVLLQLAPRDGLPLLVLGTLLGTLALITVGTLFSAMAVNLRTGEIVLPLLVIPVSLPAMIAAVKTTEAALQGASIFSAGQWLLLLCAYAGLFILVSIVTFPYVLED
jgi:heme exporter protein B